MQQQIPNVARATAFVPIVANDKRTLQPSRILSASVMQRTLGQIRMEFATRKGLVETDYKGDLEIATGMLIGQDQRLARNRPQRERIEKVLQFLVNILKEQERDDQLLKDHTTKKFYHFWQTALHFQQMYPAFENEMFGRLEKTLKMAWLAQEVKDDVYTTGLIVSLIHDVDEEFRLTAGQRQELQASAGPIAMTALGYLTNKPRALPEGLSDEQKRRRILSQYGRYMSSLHRIRTGSLTHEAIARELAVGAKGGDRCHQMQMNLVKSSKDKAKVHFMALEQSGRKDSIVYAYTAHMVNRAMPDLGRELGLPEYLHSFARQMALSDQTGTWAGLLD